MANVWTKEEEEKLKQFYPQNGKNWCMDFFRKTESQVRIKAATLGLRIDMNSDFMKESKRLMGQKRKGIKRPNHSKLMKERYSANSPMTQWVKNNGDVISKKAKERIHANGHPKGSLGLKHSEKTKEVLSQKSKEMWLRMTEGQKDDLTYKRLKTWFENGNQVVQRKASWKSGWREIGSERKFFRSAWEANYARYLQFLKDKNEISGWKHEPKTFWFEGIKRGCVSYLPDFLVIEKDGSESYHEVKGWMDDRSKTKIQRMAKYFPDIKLIVIDAQIYKSIAKTMAKILHDWE